MNKAFHWLMEVIFWLLIFLSPMLASLLIGTLVFLYLDTPLYVFYMIGVLGIVAGVIIAERIRRKYGCVNYMSRILATPDIWPTDSNNIKDE